MQKILLYCGLCLFYVVACIWSIATEYGWGFAFAATVIAFVAVTVFYFLVALVIDECELYGFLLLEKCECEAEWNPVSELPADGWYLVYGFHKKSGRGMMYSCKLTNGRWQGYKNRRVTHWRVLPEKP